MPRSYRDIPRVRARRPRDLGPRPGLDAPPRLPRAAEALLHRRAEAERARVEARSLSPPVLEAADRRIALERAVEENLARGRALTRHEIRRATDPARAGRERGPARFPRAENPAAGLLWGMACAFAAVLAPFVGYFALVFLILP